MPDYCLDRLHPSPGSRLLNVELGILLEQSALPLRWGVKQPYLELSRVLTREDGANDVEETSGRRGGDRDGGSVQRAHPVLFI